MKKSLFSRLTVGVALAVAAVGAFAAAAVGHPVTDLLSPDMLAGLGALGAMGIGNTANVGKTITEQIADMEATRAAKLAQSTQTMQKSIAEGRSMTTEEGDEVDALQNEVSALDLDLKRLRNAQTLQSGGAAPVQQKGGNPADAGGNRAPTQVQVKDNRVRNDGIAVAQMAKLLFLGEGNRHSALQLAETDAYKNLLDPRVAGMLKAAVAAGTTSNAAWAGNLVGAETTAYADFVSYLRPRTILGRFGTDGVPGLRNVPFRTALIGQSTGGAGYWVGEGQAKPVTKFDFTRSTLTPLKVANIAILTDEIVKASSPAADELVRDGLVEALRERLDIDFIDPAKAAVADVSPASILNGVTAVVSSGTDAEAVRTDIRALFAKFIAANNAPTSGVWIMPSVTALALSLMQNPLGQSEFPGITMLGGTLFGLPVIVSQYVPTATAGAVVALVNAQDIYMADEGGFQIDLSREASIQMDSAPDNPTAAGTVLVSLFQRNLVGFRAERTINWKKRRPEAAQYLSGVNWGA